MVNRPGRNPKNGTTAAAIKKQVVAITPRTKSLTGKEESVTTTPSYQQATSKN
jgi:hypothetical protein